MARIHYVHWHEGEAAARGAELTAAGHTVQIHSQGGEHSELIDPLPDALVISLDRLPSHGRAVAEWFIAAKNRRGIPVLFVGGAPEKVEATRARFPAATYGEATEVATLLESVLVPTRRS